MIALTGEDPQTVALLLGGALAGSAVSLAALKCCVDRASKPAPSQERRLPAWRPAPALPTRPAPSQVPGPGEETQPLRAVQAQRARHRRPTAPSGPRTVPASPTLRTGGPDEGGAGS